MQQIDHTMTAEEIRGLVGSAPVMLELGCHDGSDTEKFLEAMPGAHVMCFEPDPRPARRFLEKFEADSRITLVEVAIGAKNGKALFYPSGGKTEDRDDWDLSGSLQRPTNHLTRSPEITFGPPIEVTCLRLDSWFAGGGLEPAMLRVKFIWADVQGGQRAFIEGAYLTLTIAPYLYIECHEQPLYENEPRPDELIALLPDFEPVGCYARENILFRNRTLP